MCGDVTQSARPEAHVYSEYKPLLTILILLTLKVGSVISVSGMRPEISGRGPGVSGMMPDCEVLTTRGVTAVTSPS